MGRNTRIYLRLRLGGGNRPAENVEGGREGAAATWDGRRLCVVVKAGRESGGAEKRRHLLPLDGGALEFAGGMEGGENVATGARDVPIAHRTNPAAVRGPPLLCSSSFLLFFCRAAREAEPERQKNPLPSLLWVVK